MYHIRMLLACAAVLLSWLCFGGEMPVREHTAAIIEEEQTAETEVLTEETVDAVMEAVGCGVMYTPMAGRHLEDMPLPLPETEDGADEETTEVPDGASDAEFFCLTEEAAHKINLKSRESQTEIEERERQEELLRIREQKRRSREAKAARERKIAEQKAAKEAALREACPGYDSDFIATLTKEEQAEARYFYEQGFVYYRQNWSVLDDAEYGNEGFGLCGCGPTCLAAVISNLAGVPVDPEEMRVYGLKVGSWLPTGGTTYGFLIETAKKYGITCTQIYAGDKEALFAALRDENKLVLATMGPGDFTLGAHFMLFRGITDAGKILISDSYSYEYSTMEWDYDDLYAQLKTGYWIFEKTN